MNRGYTVLESINSYYGISESIIVGGSISMNHKHDFYEILREMHLKVILFYESGPFYIQIQSARRKNLLLQQIR